IEHVGVAAVPGSSFFREPINNYIRLHFAREESTLEEVIRRLTKMEALVK
ncbi:MAG: aminotransferase, partial [Clostridiales bacterium]|nr:aminotransferase [Clostridiales bacterium]